MEEINVPKTLSLIDKLIKSNFIYVICGLIICLLITAIFYCAFLRPTSNFPVGVFYTVDKGVTLSDLATKLESESIIRSAFWFKVYFKLVHNEQEIKIGDYSLENKENSWILANRFSKGDYKIVIRKTTIPEGYSTKQIGKLLEQKYFKVSFDEFVQWSKRYEGYLFPDTYFWPMNISASESVTAMKLNFDKVTRDLKLRADSLKKNWSDIVKMASVIELEANTDIDRHIISGIFWRRLLIGMPLQSNATLKYIGVNDTFVLSNDDKIIESPYNSYLNKGLPPTPICNPGYEALDASLNPTKTSYLYFLTGRDGKMYYAKTYDEHLKNKASYLDR